MMARMRPGWEFVLVHRGKGKDDPFADLSAFKQEIIDAWGDRWHRWERKALPKAAVRLGADVLHCPANTGPEKSRVPMVLTIHDLIPLEPGLEVADSSQWASRVGSGARAASRILTPSTYSKERIVEVFGVSADRIDVNFWAADAKYEQVEDAEALAGIRRKYTGQAEQKYVLAFSGADKRKNGKRILEAHSRLSDRLRDEYHLVVVGMPDPVRSRARETWSGRPGWESMHLHGFAPEEDMSALISGAEVLCYPTLAEGFGLPVLDGFRCGTAVLAGNTTSVPEVAGDAAMLADPYDVDAIAACLEKLLNGQELRDSLVRKGLARVEEFTWQATARRAVDVFEKVVREAE
jgi:glycosyltransferase involved in cell wall biosynthesis